MDQILVDHDLFVTVAISITGALFAALGTLSYFLGTMLIRRLEVKIETCQKALNIKVADVIKDQQEDHKTIYHAHNRITDHVEKHHTKD